MAYSKLRNNEKCIFLICSNVYDNVTTLKFADSWKTQNLEKKTQFFLLIRKNINRILRVIP